MNRLGNHTGWEGTYKLSFVSRCLFLSFHPSAAHRQKQSFFPHKCFFCSNATMPMLKFRPWSTCGWSTPPPLLFPQVWFPVPVKWTNKLSCELVCFTFQAEDNMKKYGKSLVNAVPDEATKLLKVLCTDYRPQRLQERKWNSEHFVFSEVCTATSTLRQALCSGTFSVCYYHQFQCCFSHLFS